MNWFDLGLPGLFTICFLAATILPLSSELIVGLFLASGYNPWLVFSIALAGNALGGSTNIALGRGGRKINSRLTERLFGSAAVQQYGAWLAWLSWVPVIGDPLLLVLGFYRTPLLPTILFMTAGKAARYTLLIWLLHG